MSAFAARVKDLIANGNAVNVSGLGTFYLMVKEDGEGGSELDAAFAPGKYLSDAAKMAEAKVTMQSASKSALESAVDMETMEENGNISAGSEKNTGIFIAPCDERGNYKTGTSDWVRVKDEDIIRNFMTEVIFKVPDVQGKYRIIIAAKAPLSGSTRADKLLKHALAGASGAMSAAQPKRTAA